jgi:UDP-N-acetylglucosamine acyltransferase
MVGIHMGHDSSVGNKVVMANNVLLAGHVEVQDGAVLGGGSVFHQFIRVGRLCMVRGGERFGMDIPPYLVAYGTNLVAGLNAIGLKRAGFGAEVRQEIKRAFQMLYRSGMNVSQAVGAAKAESWGPEASYFWEFVATAKRRGICSPPSKNFTPSDE